MTPSLWGVFHSLPDGTRAREPRVLCTSEALAQREAPRFKGSQVAPYEPTVPEASSRAEDASSDQLPLFDNEA